MNWLDKQVSLYSCNADNTGRPATLRDVLFCEFAVPHKWFYCIDRVNKVWESGDANDLETIIDLRAGEMPDEEKIRLKSTLQCFTPSALLKTKKKNHVEVIERTNILQLDFDKGTCQHYDIEEFKQAVFALPFIGFCGLSCSGTGFYALAVIAEPEKLDQYAEHCFTVLEEYGTPVDTSKGSNVSSLRYVSYDANMLIRENPDPLHIKRFKTRKKQTKAITPSSSTTTVSADKIINKAINEILGASVGSRFPTVQKWAYSLGGMQDDTALDHIKRAIQNGSQYTGVESKYLLCAEECFKDGKANPFNK